MGKKKPKKSGDDKTLHTILIVTAILNLLKAIIDLMETFK